MISNITCNAAQPRDRYFQESGTPIHEAIVELHDHIMYYMLLVVGIVIWTLLFSVWLNPIIRLRLVRNTTISLRDISHGNLIEIIWTIVPIIILIAIALPSFRLLYIIEEILPVNVTIKFLASQWYWNVEINDYLGKVPVVIDFSTYLVPTQALHPGELRLLTVDHNIIVPCNTIIRYLVSSNDVIHSLAVPSLGVKLDAIPGRLNAGCLEIIREGLYYGNCAELCGAAHFAMPVCLECVDLEKYVIYLSLNIDSDNISTY